MHPGTHSYYKVKGPHEKQKLALLEGRGEFFLRDGLSETP